MLSFLEKLPHSVDRSETMRYLVLYFLWQFSVGLVESLGLENRVPTEISASSRLNNRSRGPTDEKLWPFKISTHKSYDAHGVCSFIRERFHHFRQPFRSYILEEPFDIGPWKSFIGVKAKRSVLNENWFIGLSEGFESFFLSNFLWFSL